MPAPGKGPGSASGTGGPGSLGGSGKGSPGGFKDKDKEKKKNPNQLPPGLNPLKYSPNPTPSYEATPENIAKVVGTIVGATAGPVGTAIQAGYTGYKMATDEDFDPLNPFEKPTGTVPGSTYDKSEVVNAQTGTAASQMGANPIAAKASAEQKKKKKTATKPGFTLLQGVGGTLLGT